MQKYLGIKKCHGQVRISSIFVITDQKGGQMMNNSEIHVLLLINSNVKSVMIYG